MAVSLSLPPRRHKFPLFERVGKKVLRMGTAEVEGLSLVLQFLSALAATPGSSASSDTVRVPTNDCGTAAGSQENGSKCSGLSSGSQRPGW